MGREELKTIFMAKCLYTFLVILVQAIGVLQHFNIYCFFPRDFCAFFSIV